MKSKHGAMTVEQLLEIDKKIGRLHENRAPSVVPERSVGDTLARFLAHRMASDPDITDTAYIQEYIQSGFTRFSARRIVVKARMLSQKLNVMPMASAEPDTSSTDLMNIRPQAIDDIPVQTVNARDLHAFLNVGKDFSNWIKDRIQQHGFVEKQDFIVFAKIGENSNGGRPSTEDHLTIEATKHISMAERTPKGKEARQYFSKNRFSNDPLE